MSRIKLKSDKYKKARGGNSRVLKIFCSSCKTHILNYQKDGIGTLKRMYFDRIVGQKIIENKKLSCPNCKKLIAVPMIYKKENRPAFRLLVGVVVKSIAKTY